MPALPLPSTGVPAGRSAGVPVALGPAGATGTSAAAQAAARLVVAGRFRLSVCAVGLACCAVELVAATLASAVPAELGECEPVEVLVVAGTVTDRMVPALLALHAGLPAGSRVLSFGACSNTGGPYWDSYAVTKGVDQVLPVDVYVPGCPPRPQALLAALRQLADRPAGQPGAAGLTPGPAGSAPRGPA